LRRVPKKEEDSSLRTFILETLTQRILQNIFIDFRFLKKLKNAKNIKFLKMFLKNLCDKVLRMKNLRLLSFSFFRACRRGVLFFSVNAFLTEKIAKQNCLFLLNFRLPATLEGRGAMNKP